MADAAPPSPSSSRDALPAALAGPPRSAGAGHPPVRVLSSSEDLATRPPSTRRLSHSRAPSPSPAHGPPAPSHAAPPPTGGPAFPGAASYAANTSSPGTRPLGTMFDGPAPLPPIDTAPPAPSGRTTPTPNALSPRLRTHGPLITRVASPMDPSLASENATLPLSPSLSSSSPHLPARPLSPLSTFSRRSSSDLLSALGPPGSPQQRSSQSKPYSGFSEEDVVADLAAGGARARGAVSPLGYTHGAHGRSASADSVAASVRPESRAVGPVERDETAPSRAPAQQQRGARHELPFSTLAPRTSLATKRSSRAAAAAPSGGMLHPPLTPVLSPTSRRPLRNYELHPHSSSRFLCGGRALTSRDNAAPFGASLAVAVVLPALWWAFSAQFLWDVLGPGGKASVFVFAYVVLVMWSSMLRTALADPGILPQDLDPSPARKWVSRSHILQHEPWALVPAVEEEGPSGAGEWRVEQKWVRVRGEGVVASKWCETCHIYRPPRTSHCRLCDNCVERTDHHCAFLNNCIGRRNYLPFLAFLAASLVSGSYALAFSAWHIYRRSTLEPTAGWAARWDTVGSFVVIGLTTACLVPLAGLAGYHARLCLTNRTTIEMLRPAASRAVLSPLTSEPVLSNPWALSSAWRNFVFVACTPGAVAGRESWIDARGWAGRDAREGEEEGQGKKVEGV
ncbi:uncharacterized protein JCM10292_004287 [Rhodotorula paludigena]|uniref:uncharacterized protein n=1 Tax=Rhodotorula paludigena TaxID=86838 RepID=UPI00316BDEC9